MARRLRGATNLLGIELMNNPSTGYTPSPAFEQTELWQNPDYNQYHANYEAALPDPDTGEVNQIEARI